MSFEIVFWVACLFVIALVAVLVHLALARSPFVPKDRAGNDGSLTIDVDTIDTIVSDGSVEVDCRACGQGNRVPRDRLRDRPKCGRCRRRLLPGRKFVLISTSPLEAELGQRLGAAWDDPERLWQSVADHVDARRGKPAASKVGGKPS